MIGKMLLQLLNRCLLDILKNKRSHQLKLSNIPHYSLCNSAERMKPNNIPLCNLYTISLRKESRCLLDKLHS